MTTLASPCCSRRRRATFADRDEAYANFATKLPTGDFAEPVLRAYVEHGFLDDPASGGVRIACAPDVEAAIYQGAETSPLWTEMCPLGCPVTLIAGGDSEDHHDRSIAHAAACLDAPVKVLTGTGHFGDQEAPLEFAELVRAVLTDG